MKRYNSIDLTKFICAILILELHTGIFASVNKYVNWFFRACVDVIAVPFFFSASGFLLYCKLRDKDEREQRKYFTHYAVHILIVYAIWSLIYIIPAIAKLKAQESLMGGSVLLQYLFNFIFVGSFDTIWFLPALLFAALLVFGLSRRIKLKSVLIISFIIYLIGCLGTSYNGLLADTPLYVYFEKYFDIFKTMKNGLFFGFIFFSIGAYMAYNEPEMSLKVSLLLFLAGAVLVFAESACQEYFGWATNGCDMKLMLIPETVGLLSFCIKWEVKNPNICTHLRKLSILIFLSQRIFLTLFDYLGISQNMNSILYFISISALTVLFSEIILLASNKVRMLKYLY